jgi:hypothetical protein
MDEFDTNDVHLQVPRLLQVCEGLDILTDNEVIHLVKCEECRVLLQAFSSDRAKEMYRNRQRGQAKSA